MAVQDRKTIQGEIVSVFSKTVKTKNGMLDAWKANVKHASGKTTIVACGWQKPKAFHTGDAAQMTVTGKFNTLVGDSVKLLSRCKPMASSETTEATAMPARSENVVEEHITSFPAEDFCQREDDWGGRFDYSEDSFSESPKEAQKEAVDETLSLREIRIQCAAQATSIVTRSMPINTQTDVMLDEVKRVAEELEQWVLR